MAGDATTPYAAVNRIEAYLRSNYTYDEQPPYPTSLPDDWPSDMPAGRPPLVDFLFGSKRGYCQHFAGAMTVMLRTLGIPSRVAVGYTGGHYDADSNQWLVMDRDAHAWVEVWFPGYGWLPFDPTPGRAAPNPASVSSPDYAPTRSDVDLRRPGRHARRAAGARRPRRRRPPSPPPHPGRRPRPPPRRRRTDRPGGASASSECWASPCSRPPPAVRCAVPVGATMATSAAG